MRKKPQYEEAVTANRGPFWNFNISTLMVPLAANTARGFFARSVSHG
jgi:hypothetical protein